MSVYSMTGYASLQSSPPTHPEATAAPRLGLELRSVNSRFLDLSFKLGDELRSQETALRELLTSRIKRGKLEMRAYVIHEHSNASPAQASPSPALLQQLSRAQEQIMAWLPQAQPLSVADVLRLGAGQATASDVDHSAALLALAGEAITQFIASRAREGTRLAAMLAGHTSQLRELVKTALPMVPELVAAQQQRYVQRFNEALQQADSGGQLSAQTAQERALTEAASFAIRIDVAEELTRLEAHLGEIDDLLQGKGKPGELGKRLDFVIQELHREANTLGSKSSTLALSRISVDMKVLIEQMREQVQNIE
ncbi:YicC/YloC family endoribonuclease [Variovorax sp. PCZ-1]|uniref:YicC/YloC family endoribonuclease n=1 Tax=Variovorax sp. PCZ-1 TaxID=2835533 RepID=UPI001BCDDA2B|nr:YicC/YloC family endoribonuclease [Variovorax sp. PCZ-1]MBS7808209.1 YicC family protein [Variovorax sp. PCZ-1]